MMFVSAAIGIAVHLVGEQGTTDGAFVPAETTLCAGRRQPVLEVYLRHLGCYRVPSLNDGVGWLAHVDHRFAKEAGLSLKLCESFVDSFLQFHEVPLEILRFD
jgi:hypothetical protein